MSGYWSLLGMTIGRMCVILSSKRRTQGRRSFLPPTNPAVVMRSVVFVCLCACLCVSLTFESLYLEIWFLVCSYKLRILMSYLRVYQVFYQATVVTKVLYAASACWGFNSSQRIEPFVGRAKRCGLCHAGQPPVSSLVEDGDDKLFEYVLTNTEHSLNELLPDRRHELT